ncbi:hypothetical protein DM01DRAFT_1381388 [Hesseltinella vesiculosa]|uniref:Coiled-coil domain-containing protein 6 n=1 Tax=Hesseltinella vesiculosa TaxID=101127 RepID=A0A1X2GPG1_9FUNG|nr:hypothetical protein DM01DRAFT_1381388 [Hesseltinella vesiculosa]
MDIPSAPTANKDAVTNTPDNEKTRLLNELHQNEKALNDAIRDQLQKARRTKASMEADLEKRAKVFEQTLAQASHDGHSELAQLVATDNTQQLKTTIEQLFTENCQKGQTIKKLEFDIEMEQGHVNILRHDNQSLKQLTVNMTALAEQEEEYISNKLLKRISGLKKEKGELLMQVEQEEEYMTNMLQKKLNRLQKEKVDLENALEQEQEFIVNKLQKQLETLRAQSTSPRITMQDPASTSSSPALPTHPSPALSAKKWATSSSGTSYPDHNASGMVEMLLAEVTVLKAKASEMEKEFLLKAQQCNKYKSELVHLRKQCSLPIDDIPLDEGIPAVFRTVPPSPGRQARAKRSTSTSSQRSVTSEKTSNYAIPPLQLDGGHDPISFNSTVGPQSIPGPSSRSRSNSISSSASSTKRDTSGRRISATLFGLNSPPQQHPPHP